MLDLDDARYRLNWNQLFPIDSAKERMNRPQCGNTNLWLQRHAVPVLKVLSCCGPILTRCPTASCGRPAASVQSTTDPDRRSPAAASGSACSSTSCSSWRRLWWMCVYMCCGGRCFSLANVGDGGFVCANRVRTLECRCNRGGAIGGEQEERGATVATATDNDGETVNTTKHNGWQSASGGDIDDRRRSSVTNITSRATIWIRLFADLPNFVSNWKIVDIW